MFGLSLFRPSRQSNISTSGEERFKYPLPWENKTSQMPYPKANKDNQIPTPFPRPAGMTAQDSWFIINRAPTDTCFYNDSKDFSAIITEVYICRIYTTRQGYIFKYKDALKRVFLFRGSDHIPIQPQFFEFSLLASYLSTLQKQTASSLSFSSDLVPSVTRVAICVFGVLLEGLQKKERVLVVYCKSRAWSHRVKKKISFLFQRIEELSPRIPISYAIHQKMLLVF